MPLDNFIIRNKWQFTGQNRWDWEAFIDDQGSGDLDKIDHVEYILHPTFVKPIQKVFSRGDQFRIKTNGWGTFLIKAMIHAKNGETIALEHLLVLERDPAYGIS